MPDYSEQGWIQSIRDATDFFEARDLWLLRREKLPGETDSEMGFRMVAEIDSIHGSFLPEDRQESIDANQGNDVPTTFIEETDWSRIGDNMADHYVPSGDDIDGADADGLLRESGENQQVDLAKLGIEDGISFDDFFQAADTYNASLLPTYTQGERSGSAGGTTQNNSASEALSDPTYQRIVNGWNKKLRASSEDLSGLTPFCELYAIFDDNDLIYQEKSNRYTAIKDRLYDVKFVGARENIKAPLPEGISVNCKISKIAGENKSQISPDSILNRGDDQYDPYSSFKGVPGISDLSVSRGSGGGAQNVKYDLTLTMPNPEIINEKFEYSKLMLMNSAFLIVYGWNIKDSNFDVDYYPPDIVKGINNIVPIGSGLGGFWSSAVISLYNFQFDFDTVGHLVGKLQFLNSTGIFLGSMQVEAVGNTMFKSLTEPAKTVLDRVNNNQDFIWQNGVPWSTIDGNAELQAMASDDASKASVVRSFFGNDRAGWNEATVKHIGSANFTSDTAEDLRDRIFSLRDLGEDFLINFRKYIINKLFERKRAGTLSTGEEKTMEELAGGPNIKDLGTDRVFLSLNWSSQQVIKNGRSYSGGDEEDKIIDVYYAGNIKNAWNNFFLVRFEGMSNSNNQGDNSNVIPMTILEETPEDVNVGSSYSDFSILSGVSSGTGEADMDVSFIEVDYARGELVPKVFAEIMRSTPTAPSTDGYIKNMPPFGKVLQGKTVDEFGQEGNLNYRLFNGSNPVIDSTVLELIKNTSVVSVPVPIDNQDAAMLSIEKRSYSEIMEKSPQEVIISFEFLNEVPSIGGGVIPDTIYKINFHNTSVLTSLESMDGVKTVNPQGEEINLVTQLKNDPPNDPKLGIEIGAGLEGYLFRDYLSESFNVNAIADGRFVQWKYAVLKNGYVVRQYKDNPTKQTFTDIGVPQLAVTNDGRPGLSFLNDLLPSDILTAFGEPGVTENTDDDDIALYGDVKTWEQVVDEQREVFQAEVTTMRLILENEDTNRDVSEQAAYANARDGIGAAIKVLTNFNILADLGSAIASAIQGSNALRREEMGTANQDEVSIQDGEGETTHTIFRQPVYFFLGSVLESLRITTNNRVKFHYSKIPARKVGEPFHISIPESTGNSIEASYDSQIAYLTSELAILHAGNIDTEEKTVRLIVDDSPPTSQEAAELERRQGVWDERLALYIKSRGQDVASLGYNDRGRQSNTTNSAGNDKKFFAQNSGVYEFHTSQEGESWRSRPRSPNFKYSNDDGYVEDSYQTDVDVEKNEINIRPPWIYRIGDKDNYYGSEKWRSGGNYIGKSPATNYGWPVSFGPEFDNGPGFIDNYRGFMRLWRPEDLNAALTLELTPDLSFYYRDPKGNWPMDNALATANSTNNAGFPSFTTDSFGEGNLVTPAGEAGMDHIVNEKPGMPDYGLQDAFIADSGGAPYNDMFGSYDVKAVNDDNTSNIIRKLIEWLNWYPVSDAAADIGASDYNRRYGFLGKSPHLVHTQATGSDNPNSIESYVDEASQKTVSGQEAAAEHGWYLINWESGGGLDQGAGGPVDYTARNRLSLSVWVKGVVVDDFVYMEGARPTGLHPLPLQGETAADTRLRYQRIAELKNRRKDLQDLKRQADITTQFKNLPIKSTYEIPVYIDTVDQFLNSEPRAPLHNLLKKILGAAKETLPAVQLSMRPMPSDPSYIDIFPSAMNYDGVIQEVFTEVDVNQKRSMGQAIDADPYQTDILSARKNINYGGLVSSEKVMVCQFGTGQSLVENFGLNSKIDPTAFSAFRLPAVVGGANMNLTEILRYSRDKNAPAFASLLGDFAAILNNGLTKGLDTLKDLKIVSESADGLVVNEENLNNFLLSENVPAISKAATSFIEDMMSQDVAVYNKILILQNQYFTGLDPNMEGFTGDSAENARLPGSKFYGNVLSTFLRTANLTIHGTTGLNVFNLIYLKGLLSGVEGLYLISSVNESIAASTFTTTLECKLIEYINNNSKTNPLAYRGDSDLNRLGSMIDKVAAEEDVEFGIDYNIEELDDFIQRTDRARGFIS